MGTSLVAAGAIVLTGGIQSVGLMVYATLPISAAWLIGYNATLWTAGVCVAGSLAAALLEMGGVGPWGYARGRPLGLWFLLVEATVMATVPVAQMLKILKEALAESRLAETALRKRQAYLEETVQLRGVELALARDQAQAANQAKNVFLANMSLEMRAPLNTVLGFSNNLRRDPASSPEQRKDLDVIRRCGEHLRQLVDDVLDVARTEAGRAVVVNENVDLDDLVRGIKDIMVLRAEEKGLQLSYFQSPGCPCMVRTDAAKLRQVLINLLGNALKYTEHGSVMLRSMASPADSPERCLLRFEVEDTGIGIAAEDQARIFEPFVQVGQLVTRKGAGLGLTISKKFVELMGGSISVKSALGKGSTFRVEIPGELVMDSPEPETEGAWRQVICLAPSQPDYRILIVEDQRENSLLLQRLLEGVGFRIQVAEDGADGVEMFRTWRPQFIWMDVRMPVVSGLETARIIRTMPGGKAVKIVALSASVLDHEREQVLDAGPDDFVGKPYRAEDIFQCMARHLGVQYLYREPSISGVEPALASQTEAFKALPEELRFQLSDALIALDVRRIAGLIQRVSERDPVLGSLLAGCADRLAYTPILRALGAENSS
jgi:signal transduction histidine kinase/ActR/RegA family two-component response regulator